MKPGSFVCGPLLLLAASACSGTPARNSPVTRSDSAGIRIVFTPRDARPEDWRLDAAPFLDLTRGISPANDFTRIRGMTRLGDGRFVVLDGGSCQIYFFGVAGEPLLQTGGCGRRAGNFGSLWLVGRLMDDALIVWDGELSRFTRLDARGQWIESIDLPSSNEAVTPWQLFTDSRVLATVRPAPASDIAGSATQDTTVLWDFDLRTRERASVVRKPGVVWWTGARGRQGVPFTGNPVFALSGDDVVIAAGIDHVIERWSRGGRLLARYVDERPAVRLSTGEISEYRDAELRSLEAARARERLREWSALPLPTHKLAYDRLLSGPDRTIWARDFEWRDDREHHWSVFDSTGAVIARVRTPPFLEIDEIHADLVLGRGSEERGSEHAWVYRLQRPERSGPPLTKPE